MAYYLDSSFDLGSYSNEPFDESHTLLSNNAFDVDSTIFSDPGSLPSRTTGPLGSSSSNYTHFPDSLAPAPSFNVADPISTLGESTSSNPFGPYDLDLPFGSSGNQVPVRSLTRDGRLKTRLMGVGSDGGFLTSPLIVGKARVDSRTSGFAAPEIAINSPIPPPPQSSFMTPGDPHSGVATSSRSAPSEMMPSLSVGSTASSMGFTSTSMSMSGSRPSTAVQVVVPEPTGLGMGISGLGDLQDTMGGFGADDLGLRSYGMAKGRTTGHEGYLGTSQHLSSSQTRRTRSATGDGRSAPSGFNGFDYLSFRLPPPPVPETSFLPTRTLPTRTINKAKSCSALAVQAREQNEQAMYEPLTPVSADHSAFAPSGATFGTPRTGHVEVSNTGPLSFADLYNIGLVEEATVDELDGQKKDIFDHGAVDTISIGLGMSGGANLLPPNFGIPSALSSPSTPYLSDPSPDRGVQYDAYDGLASAPMYPASSVDSTFSATTTHSPLPDVAGRQRSVTYDYATPPVPEDEMSYGRPSRQRQQQLPPDSAYGGGRKNFSYPTRYASQLQVPPPTQWSGSQGPPLLPLPPVPTTPTRQRFNPHSRCLTGPAGSMADYEPHTNVFVSHDMTETYERKLATFDSLYDPYADAAATPSKRARDDDVFSQDDSDIALSPEAEESQRTSKRLRSVASAPCLSGRRRLRPGPKPKTVKSPQQEHQSVFSANLSPPIPQIHRAISPYASPLLSEDDGEGFLVSDGNGNIATPASITYAVGPPAEPGQPRSSVPREVIQSLYAAVPAHTAADGTKVSKRYGCLIEGCGRSFPRKSAIESHIQTHLEDKPFVCPHDDCDASFVRQHDLRRHERIHSGNKPFPCPCGKGFARGDALARHRARGICSGSLVPRRG
ncbi:microtubule-associated protein [Rhodotorula toruloides]|uniref:Microtubule-associated protein n=1 Tax=Rhodotorula toruloides TaxID=5286 RepID=A0A511KIB1_RHOTO|nr:microtubule-associated protein [Rhodotorula toruloides]